MAPKFSLYCCKNLFYAVKIGVLLSLFVVKVVHCSVFPNKSSSNVSAGSSKSSIDLCL